MENIFMKVYFYINLKGKKINNNNEKLLKEIIDETKIRTQQIVDDKLEKEDKN